MRYKKNGNEPVVYYARRNENIFHTVFVMLRYTKWWKLIPCVIIFKLKDLQNKYVFTIGPRALEITNTWRYDIKYWCQITTVLYDLLTHCITNMNQMMTTLIFWDHHLDTYNDLKLYTIWLTFDWWFILHQCRYNMQIKKFEQFWITC